MTAQNDRVYQRRNRSTDCDNLPANDDNSSVVEAVCPITLLLPSDIPAIIST